MSKLLAPNGKPSNLSPEQYKLVRTPAFKQWFGDWEKLALTKLHDSGIDEVSLKRLEDVVSDVVDSNGEPLVVFHTTDYLDEINVFRFNDDYSFQQWGYGIYFTNDKEHSESYFEGENYIVYEVFLNLKKPIITNQKEKGFNKKYFLEKRESSNESGAIIFHPDRRKWNYYIAGNPNQIKLADGSNTTFDGKNPDIRFDEGGEARPYTDDGNKLVVYQTKDYKIAVDNIDNARYITLWFVNSLFDIDVKVGYLALYETEDRFLKVQEIDIQKQHRGKGLSIIMYLIALKYSSDNIKGIKSYLPDRVNKKQVPKIYKKLNAKNIDDWSYIYKSDNVKDFKKGGQVIINPTEIECHKCHWNWKVKDGGDDLFICHKCNYDNTKFYKFEGLKGDKILDTISYKQGGRTIAQTPAPKKDRIYGSEKNKPESSKDSSSAKQIKFSDELIEAIKNKVDSHNKKYPNKEITIESAKAVVRRGMGAYSSTYRPTISGGKPNSRVAWGLARLNAFLYKIVNGKSKSGKYSQDNDLIKELGYKVEKFSDGGDIQVYKEAMDISEFKEGGEAKPKKVYVSIQLPSEIEKLNKTDYSTTPEYFYSYSEKPFQELKNGKLEGLVGVSTSPNNIAEWFVHRDCLIVMNYEDFMAINETETINYYDPYQLMANKLYLFKRLYANVSRYGEQQNVYKQTLTKIGEKIRSEIILEMNLSTGQRYSELYRIDRFLDPYITSAFYSWVDEKQNVESPIDLTNEILGFNEIYDNYLGVGFENPVLTFDELLPIVEKGITNASKIYESEQEIILINRELNIPKNSQLFFIGKNELSKKTQSNKLELIEKYQLKDSYKIHFVDVQQLEKYRSIWLAKEEQKFNDNLEKGRQDLEFKKEQVLEELLDLFLEKSLNSIKNEIEKDILDSTDSFDFYDRENDEYFELNWYYIPIVQDIINTYIFTVKNFWKSFIEKKQVKNLDLYAFSNFQNSVHSELKKYFEDKKEELEELYNYRNTTGSYSLQPYLFERLLLKSVYDYENSPEWIDYKELSKMYLDKMGREIYRYYDKKDLQLISQYNDGGVADEPTEFWGTEAGGVLVYCSTTHRYLILLRSEWVLEPNTWGIISGKLDDEENVQEAVLREAEEETGQKLNNLIPSFIFEKPNFKFHNFVSIVNEEFIPKLDWENSDFKWVKLNEMPDNLHFGLKLLLQKEDLPTLVEKNKNTKNKNQMDKNSFNTPLLIRLFELIREEVKSDVALHEIVENIIEIRDKGTLTMSDYDSIVGNVLNSEQKVVNPNNQEVMFNEEHKEYFYEDFIDGKFVTVWLGKDYIPQEETKQEKMAEGGNVYDERKIKVLATYTEQQFRESEKELLIKKSDFKKYQKTGEVPREIWDEMTTYTTEEHFTETRPLSLYLEKINGGVYDDGGRVESIHSSKGDIKIMLDENWYSDDTDVELVPVSELIKFREFDRKVKPKYNQDNSIDNINHLKYMFQKEGVKSPLIIEYSAQDNAVLVIEGNHRINSAIDLGMEYLPARVVLRKYSKFSPSQLKNTIKVSGVLPDKSGYIPSALRPSVVGIQGSIPISYREGGIIEGRLHSECGDDGCGRKFQVGENGHIIEAERDEAVIVSDAFNDNQEYTLEGTPKEIASALNVMGGGKNFESGAEIIKDGKKIDIPELKVEAKDTDVDDVIDPNSIIINRRSMADEQEYKVTGTPKEIASAINSVDGNGVVIKEGAEMKKVDSIDK
jgi:8-oxo-dGTP pyrophosphatase MutT (NUDIX family)